MTSLSALIAQVEADVTRLEYEWDDEIGFRVTDAAPVLAAALKDAVEMAQEIADATRKPNGVISIAWYGLAVSRANSMARSFLERHKETPDG